MAVAGRFGADEAAVYDGRIQRMIPGYHTLQELARAELAAALPGPARMLVVGAGTGRELELLAPDHPSWRFTAVDPAAAMVEVATAKAEAGGYAHRVSWQPGHVGEYAAPPPGDRYDAAVMILVAHFLPVEEKRSLFTDIADRLRPGAPLVFADLDAAAEPGSALARVRRAAAVDGGMSPEHADMMITNMWRQLHPLGAEPLAELLAGCGLRRPRTFFRALGYRGAVTTKDDRAERSAAG